ncbi:hypothetical protein HDU97_001295 [Phlyctochytrium planicorne]|nr:hypothetical protein HDU97_001295 [Phlyctochytrium planicorne]
MSAKLPHRGSYVEDARPFQTYANPDPPKELPSKSTRSILIFSGGSAANPFVPMLQSITDNICHILPVSDDGGSTSMIVQVVGGPGIGDIRSRLVRLAETKTVEAAAVHNLLSYRLPVDPPSLFHGMTPARLEWASIVEGTHPLWKDISEPYRETIRAFLLQFHHQILKQAGHGPVFDFRGGSIGNFFLTGCRLFFDSLEAAIFQFARITRAPSRTDVMSVVASNKDTVAIAATLRDGSTISGQCEISHPGAKTSQANPHEPPPFVPSTHGTPRAPRKQSNLQQKALQKSMEALALGSNSLLDAGSRSTSTSNLIFSKAPNATPPLPSPIRRIFYINSEQSETFPSLNQLTLPHFTQKKTIIYSIGSLYTSLIPCLIVPGVGGFLADDLDHDDLSFTDSVSSARKVEMVNSATSMSPPQKSSSPLKESILASQDDSKSDTASYPDVFMPLGRVKILILNGTFDRETEGYTAMDFVLAITDALNYSCIAESSRKDAVRKVTTRDVIQDMDHAVHIRSRESSFDRRGFGTESISDMYESEEVMESSKGRTYHVQPFPPRAFITHMLYPADGLIPPDVNRIERLGITCIRVPTSTTEKTPKGHYGVEELQAVLEQIVV